MTNIFNRAFPFAKAPEKRLYFYSGFISPGFNRKLFLSELFKESFAISLQFLYHTLFVFSIDELLKQSLIANFLFNTLLFC